MKVLLLSTAYPYRGGITHFVETLARGLINRGDEVQLVTFTRQYPEVLFPGKTQLETAPPPTDLRITRLLDTLNPVSWWKTAQFIARENPDLVLLKYWMPFFAPAFGTVIRHLRKRHIPAIVIVDNAIPHEKRWGDWSLSRWLLRACKGLVVMSASVQKDVEKLGVNRPVRLVTHPIYNLFGDSIPLEAARKKLNLNEKTPVLLFFGFIRRYKGLHVLLEAMPLVQNALPDVKLLVAGEFYEDEAPYRTQIEASNIGNVVELHNEYIPNDRVPVYFSAADVVVQPYITATQSGVAQIAFQFDKPTILTDVGGLVEVVPDGVAGLVVPPENPQALAQAIIRFFHENLSPILTAGVKREKAKYDWKHLFSAIDELLETP
ncbi:MAG TPA: glycosyltransferase [Rhodothermales bacterium]|nr:glycosyltransferase [Rhodothermales bacterium]